jgi:hypothetical protein
MSGNKEMIANYIKNQREHHKQTDFVSEYRRLLEEQGIRIDERFFPWIRPVWAMGLIAPAIQAQLV